MTVSGSSGRKMPDAIAHADAQVGEHRRGAIDLALQLGDW